MIGIVQIPHLFLTSLYSIFYVLYAPVIKEKQTEKQRATPAKDLFYSIGLLKCCTSAGEIRVIHVFNEFFIVITERKSLPCHCFF